ncbi:peroxide stress protein YaaA [Paremcibacter congregatus]|uniref:peroxide stress protein YaaA n=1 Tax=Paremcibacter congregatus TaxID=2043170 RepID=UPI0030EEAD16|tara:strand:+ start:1225 stop:1998 length:774 start_codon:yes stop_codon:yes gene_type:complete
MLVVTSPAKKLDFSEDVTRSNWTVPDFLDDSNILIEAAKKLTRDDLMKLMKISENLAELNYNRYRSFSLPFTPANAKQAVFAFTGDTYVGLDADSLDEDDLAYAQDHYRILSGLYGLLRPLDLMQPYRLEMGKKVATEKSKNLYEFWGDKLTEALNEQMKAQNTDILVNCASNEYFKAVHVKKLEGQVITPVFKEVKEGHARMIGMFAKKARGMMARYIIQNRVEQAEELKRFNLGGYKFQPSLSDETTLEFHRVTG